MVLIAQEDLGRELMAENAVADPWPIYDRMRSIAPIYRSDAQNAWIVTSFAAAEEMLAANELFSSEGTRGRNVYTLQPEQRSRIHLTDIVSTEPALTHSDLPSHTAHRAAASRPLSPKSLGPRRSWIGELCVQMAEQMEQLETPDLVADYALPLSLKAVAGVFGSPPGNEELYLELARCQRAFYHEFDPPFSAALELEDVLARFKDHLWELIEQKRTAPDDSLLATILDPTVHGYTLTEDEILGVCVQFLGAAFETTISAIIAAIYGLISTGQYATARETPGAAMLSFLEALRWQAPAHRVPRRAVKDVTFAGTDFAANDLIFVMLGAANRDPAVFDEPDVFDFQREIKPHLAFGMGIHACAGSGLARLEGISAIQTLFDRYPNLRFAEGWEPVWTKFPAARTLQSLTVNLH